MAINFKSKILLNMKQPLVSILAPCYNGARFLHKFFESLLEQQYKKIELVFINDGSIDDSEKIVYSYKAKMEACGMSLIYEYRENAGIGAAIDRGLKLMHGEYFTWIGIDDYYHPLFLKKLVSCMEENKKYSVVRDDGDIVDENDNTVILGKMADANYDKYNEHLFDNAILERNFQFGYSLVRTADFLKINPKRTIYPSREGQNWQILLPLFYNGLSAFYSEPLYYVLNNSHSVSRDPRKGGLKKLLAQKEEYKKILTETLCSFQFQEREKYLLIVNDKYARMEMRLGYEFNDGNLLKRKYQELKKLGTVKNIDHILYLRFHFPIFNKILVCLKTFFAKKS